MDLFSGTEVTGNKPCMILCDLYFMNGVIGTILLTMRNQTPFCYIIIIILQSNQTFASCWMAGYMIILLDENA